MDPLVQKTLYLLLALFAIGALFITFFLSRNQRKSVWIAYFLEGLTLTVILFPAYCGGWVLSLFILGLGALTLCELYKTLSVYRPYTVVGLVGGTFLLLGDFGPLMAIFVAAFLLLLVTISVCSKESSTLHLKRIGSTLFGLIYPTLGWLYLGMIAIHENGFGLVLFLYGLIEINDAAAYLVGKAFGKKKIWLKLSPNKTYVGSMAGLIGAVGMAFTLQFSVPDFSLLQLLFMGLFLGILGQVGDLFASGVKRLVGAKDFGDWIPTQGSALDIYDSLLFVAPFFYYLIS